GLLGHRHVGLYGPHGINVRETINAIEKNRDFVKGIKCQAEGGGYSRRGIETLRLGKEASRATKVPVYVHLGRLWAEENGTAIDPDSVIDDALPLLDPGAAVQEASRRVRVARRQGASADLRGHGAWRAHRHRTRRPHELRRRADR